MQSYILLTMKILVYEKQLIFVQCLLVKNLVSIFKFLSTCSFRYVWRVEFVTVSAVSLPIMSFLFCTFCNCLLYWLIWKKNRKMTKNRGLSVRLLVFYVSYTRASVKFLLMWVPILWLLWRDPAEYPTNWAHLMGFIKYSPASRMKK